MEKDQIRIILKKIFKGKTSRFVEFLKPVPLIGGLSVAGSALRYFEFKGGKERSVSLRLPPGIIVDGKINDRENFIAALKTVHKEAARGSREPLQIVLSLEGSVVYAQTFTVPGVSEYDLDETATLNLQMISPVDVKQSYCSWQKIGRSSRDQSQIELLGAFVAKDVVDAYVSALKEADYQVVAVEFSSLGMVRSIDSTGLFAKDVPYIVAEVLPEGLEFLIVKNSCLYFDYFYSWSSLQGVEKSITLSQLEEAMASEIRKMVNFYMGHWGGKIENILLVAPSMQEKLYRIVQGKFPDLETGVVVPKQISSAHGAALRGLVPRSQDTDLSLMSVSAQQVFERDQVVSFIIGWRNVFTVVLGFLLTLFVFIDIFLHSFSAEVDRTAKLNVQATGAVASAEVTSKVNEFNSMVALVRKAKTSDNVVSPFFDEITTLKGVAIELDRINFPGVGKQAVLEGTGMTEHDVLLFKKALSEIPQFTDINLPLESMMPAESGRYTFLIRFTVTSLSFTPLQAASTSTQIQQLDATLSQISQATGNLITFDKIGYVSNSKPITVTGTAANENVVYLLRDQLMGSKSFTEVFLFSNDIASLADGRVSFKIQFRLK